MAPASVGKILTSLKRATTTPHLRSTPKFRESIYPVVYLIPPKSIVDEDSDTYM
ncbi:MAG: hypothetical protein M1503_08210 [Thaumarchaeota archaeon]|nr:hypothetical protein [Nitrososphaerota archaeon]MCL5318224.1 hypothetical protein [Nitrososphaerota archaeon]